MWRQALPKKINIGNKIYFGVDQYISVFHMIDYQSKCFIFVFAEFSFAFEYVKQRQGFVEMYAFGHKRRHLFDVISG